MTTPNPAEVIAEALAKHRWRGNFMGCGCGWNWAEPLTYMCGEDARIERAHVAHQASVIAALPDIEIVPNGTSAAMGAFAAGSVTKQRVLEDIAYVLTGWRFEENEETWEAVARAAIAMGNGRLVREIEKSYADNGGES